MHPPSLLAAAVLLAACPWQPDKLGGFTLYPALPTAPGQSRPSLEFTADGTLWLTYMETYQSWQAGLRPARLGPQGWDLQPRRDVLWEGQLIGVAGDSLVARLVPVTATAEPQAEVRSYGGGAWSQPLFTTGDTQYSPASFAVAADGSILQANRPDYTDVRAQLYTPSSGVTPLGDAVVAQSELAGFSDLAVAFLPTGEPLVAVETFVDGVGSVRVLKWDGAGWVAAADVLTIVEGGFHGQEVTLLADSQDRLWVITHGGSGEARPKAWRWSGAAWEAFDPGPAPAGYTNQTYATIRVRARVDGDDRLVLLLAIDRSMEVRRLGGTQREDVGPGIQEDAPILGEALAIGPDGTIAVAWHRQEQGFFAGPGSSTIRVARYTGGE